MQQMEEMILKEGQVLPGGILKVGSFLNQQIDTVFLREIGEEIARLYDGAGVTKILTIESSGIALAAADETEQIIFADIDLGRVDEVRAQLPTFLHLRRDVYTVAE